MLSIEWLDIYYIQEVIVHRLPVHINLVDHSSWIEELVKGVGLDYDKGEKMIRIFGYSPRNRVLFDE